MSTLKENPLAVKSGDNLVETIDGKCPKCGMVVVGKVDPTKPPSDIFKQLTGLQIVDVEVVIPGSKYRLIVEREG